MMSPVASWRATMSLWPSLSQSAAPKNVYGSLDMLLTTKSRFGPAATSLYQPPLTQSAAFITPATMYWLW